MNNIDTNTKKNKKPNTYSNTNTKKFLLVIHNSTYISIV